MKRLSLQTKVRFINIQDPYGESDTPDELAPSSPHITLSPATAMARSSAAMHASNYHSGSDFPFGLEALSTIATSDPYSWRMAAPGRSSIQLPRLLPQSPSPSVRPLSTDTTQVSLPPLSWDRASPKRPRDIRSPIDPSLAALHSPPTSHHSPSSLRATAREFGFSEDEREIAFLLRHYAEVPGYG